MKIRISSNSHERINKEENSPWNIDDVMLLRDQIDCNETNKIDIENWDPNVFISHIRSSSSSLQVLDDIINSISSKSIKIVQVVPKGETPDAVVQKLARQFGFILKSMKEANMKLQDTLKSLKHIMGYEQIWYRIMGLLITNHFPIYQDAMTKHYHINLNLISSDQKVKNPILVPPSEHTPVQLEGIDDAILWISLVRSPSDSPEDTETPTDDPKYTLYSKTYEEKLLDILKVARKSVCSKESYKFLFNLFYSKGINPIMKSSNNYKCMLTENIFLHIYISPKPYTFLTDLELWIRDYVEYYVCDWLLNGKKANSNLSCPVELMTILFGHYLDRKSKDS